MSSFVVDDWSELEPASIVAPSGGEMFLVVLSHQQSGGLRLAPRERPYQPGEKLDETGRKARTFRVDFVFHNDITEELPGPPMWPDRANELETILEDGRTFTLHLHWRRNIRVKAESYERIADPEQYRGGELMRVNFREDNEDSLDDGTEFPTVVGTVRTAAQEARFDADSEGIGLGGLEDLTALASALEEWINLPGEWTEGVAVRARRLRSNVRRIIDAHSQGQEGSSQLLDPQGARLLQRLIGISEAAARAVTEAESRFPPTQTVRFPVDRSIYDIANELKQSARDLVAVNSDIDDPAFIPAGTPVQVFKGFR